MKKSEMQSGSLDCYSIAIQSVESSRSAKSSKHKKPITYLFETKIVVHFLQYLKDNIR